MAGWDDVFRLPLRDNKGSLKNDNGAPAARRRRSTDYCFNPHFRLPYSQTAKAA
jgi:hypothetical protein